MTASLIAFAGWAGAGCMLLGYGLMSTNRIQAGPVFQILNLCGASGLLLSGVTHSAWPSVTLNLAWLLISVATLTKQQRQQYPSLPRAVETRLRRRNRRRRGGGWPRYRLHRDPARIAYRVPDQHRYVGFGRPIV